MVPFGSLSTDMGCWGACTDPLCEWGRETAWSTGGLGAFVIAVGAADRLPDGCVNQGDPGRGLERTLSSTL